MPNTTKTYQVTLSRGKLEIINSAKLIQIYPGRAPNMLRPGSRGVTYSRQTRIMYKKTGFIVTKGYTDWWMGTVLLALARDGANKASQAL